MVYWFATGVIPPAFAYSCYYLWRSGTEAQLESMGLSKSTDETAFTGVIAGLGTLVGTYVAVSNVVVPMVSAPEKKLQPGQAAKVESFGQFARLAGPSTVVRGSALFFGFYTAGRVKTWLSCRGLQAKEAEKKAKDKAKAKDKGKAKDKQRPA